LYPITGNKLAIAIPISVESTSDSSRVLFAEGLHTGHCEAPQRWPRTWVIDRFAPWTVVQQMTDFHYFLIGQPLNLDGSS
jgi:hypothetical protein